MFDSVMAQRRADLDRAITRHADASVGRFNEAQSDARSALALDMLGDAAARGDAIDAGTQEHVLLSEAAGRARRQGLDAEAVGVAQRKALATAHADVVERLADADPLRAQAWLDDHGDAIADPAVRNRLAALLRPYVELQEADDLAVRIRAAHPDREARHAHVAGLDLPAGRAEALSAALLRADRAEAAAERKRQQQAADDAWQRVLDPAAARLAAIPAPVYAALASDERQAVHHAIAANARGEDAAPHPALYLQLADKAASGMLDVTDVRRAWGRLPRNDWDEVANWQREIAEHGLAADASALQRRVLAAGAAILRRTRLSVAAPGDITIGISGDSDPLTGALGSDRLRGGDGPDVIGSYLNGPQAGERAKYRTGDVPPPTRVEKVDGQDVLFELYALPNGDLKWFPVGFASGEDDHRAEQTAQRHHLEAEAAVARLRTQPLSADAPATAPVSSAAASAHPQQATLVSPNAATGPVAPVIEPGGAIVAAHPHGAALTADAVSADLVLSTGADAAAAAPGAAAFAPIANALRPYVLRGLRSPLTAGGLALGAGAAVTLGKWNRSFAPPPAGTGLEIYPPHPSESPRSTGTPISPPSMPDVESYPREAPKPPDVGGYPAFSPQPPIIVSTPIPTAPLSPPVTVMRNEDWVDSRNLPDLQRIELNGYSYFLDKAGRAVRIIGTLTSNPDQARNSAAQLEAGGTDRLASDEGGHFIARIFNGPRDSINHFAQNRNFNRSAYRKMERAWQKALAKGSKVEFEINVEYDADSQRPSSIEVRWKVDGIEHKRKFNNGPGGK